MLTSSMILGLYRKSRKTVLLLQLNLRLLAMVMNGADFKTAK